MSLISDLLDAIETRLESVDALIMPRAIAVVRQNEMTLISQMEDALADTGLAVLVEWPDLMDEGTELVARCVVSVHENVVQNRGASGTQQDGYEYALAIAGALRGWAPGEMWAECHHPQIVRGESSAEMVIWLVMADTRTILEVN